MLYLIELTAVHKLKPSNVGTGSYLKSLRPRSWIFFVDFQKYRTYWYSGQLEIRDFLPEYVILGPELFSTIPGLGVGWPLKLEFTPEFSIRVNII